MRVVEARNTQQWPTAHSSHQQRSNCLTKTSLCILLVAVGSGLVSNS